MHPPVDPALFAAAPRTPAQVGGRIAIVLTVLVANAATRSGVAAAGIAVTGFGLLGLGGGPGRLVRGLGWTAAAVGGAAGASLIAGAPATALVSPTLRLIAGMSWLLWLGAGLDWPSVRDLLRGARMPLPALRTLDHAVLHGLLTRAAWIRRRDAARARLGRARLAPSTWGAILAEGALEAVDRVERVETGAWLRAAPAPSPAPISAEAARLTGVELDRDGGFHLHPLDLALGSGETLVVCGPSGAGKSTLLALLAGLAPHRAGTLQRLGVTVPARAPLGRRLDGRVGLLGQNPEHHFLASTAVEDVAWGLERRGVGRAEALARARQALARLGVEPLADRAVHTLSFGEQRRVALAGLLVVEPALLLLDEPTSGLDPVAAAALVEELCAYTTDRGAACVWVTHDLLHLPPTARRALLLRDGRVLYDGPRERALTPEALVHAGLRRADAPSPSPSTPLCPPLAGALR